MVQEKKSWNKIILLQDSTQNVIVITVIFGYFCLIAVIDKKVITPKVDAMII